MIITNTHTDCLIHSGSMVILSWFVNVSVVLHFGNKTFLAIVYVYISYTSAGFYLLAFCLVLHLLLLRAIEPYIFSHNVFVLFWCQVITASQTVLENVSSSSNVSKSLCKLVSPFSQMIDKFTSWSYVVWEFLFESNFELSIQFA